MGDKYISLRDIYDAMIRINREGKKMERETAMNILTAIVNLPPADVVERWRYDALWNRYEK